ncbi:MAG: FtsX-like permease family protein [Candidatus Rokubacteria bacterium]|nr:FtsX-like permease family protein [Candidatus Rokubacteria bacterium]
MTLGVPVRMAWRQTRGAWRHFVAFFACVALGVAALVSVGTLAANLDGTLAREAKALMGGAVELRSARPLDRDADGALARLRRAGATTASVRELVGMALHPARGTSLLVELKAVDAAWPLYGRVETRPGTPLEVLLAERDGAPGAVVEAQLLERLGLAVGDALAIGAARFTVTGVIAREPDRAAGFVTLGPRVLIAGSALERTGLLRVGSRVRYRTLVRLPDALPARAAHERLARELADPSVRLAVFDDAQPGLRRFFTQLASYLGLVGLTSLLVGGIGVASSVATFVRRQLGTIAVLKCLGATARMLLATYLVQMQALGVLGSLAGAGLGVAIQPALVGALAPFAPFALEARLDAWTVARGVAMGTLAALLAALWPLLAVRAVPPALVLRSEVEAGAWQARRRWAAALPIAAGLVALAFWQAGSPKLGAIFVGASAAALALLVLLARALVTLARSLPRPGGLAWRHGLAGLHRPGGHTARIVPALGLGVMLLVAIALLEANLGRQIAFEQKRAAPSFFFVDVQDDQREAFSRLVSAANGGTAPALTPVVRSRIAAINGAPVTRGLIDRRKAEAPDKIWYLTREYVLTFAGEPPLANAITRGRWWTAAEAARRPRVSMEEDAARYLGVGVGGTLTFDVQGVPVEAEVMSLRKVDWQSLSMNFFAILSPGALDGAPATWVATARVPAAAETGLQDTVVAAFPNVTAIPVRAVLARVGAVLDQIAFAVRFMALFSVAAGLVVMAGALTATRYQRLYESVILKTLGATRGAVARAFAVEYACLGAAAGVGGSLLAAALAWVVLRFVLDVPWALEPGPLVAGVLATTAVSLAVGFLATFRLLGRKPLEVLRQD